MPNFKGENDNIDKRFGSLSLKRIFLHLREAFAILSSSLALNDFRRHFKYRRKPFGANIYKNERRVQLYYDLVKDEREMLFKFILQRYIDPMKNRDCIHVLDLGCGPGIFESQALMHHKNLRVTAVDISFSMLIYASNKINSIGSNLPLLLINSDFESFIHSTHTNFDLILCIATCRFIENAEMFFQSLRSRLKKDGIVIFRVLRTTGMNIVRIFIWSLLTSRLRSTLLELDFYLFKVLQAHGFDTQLIKLPTPLQQKIYLLEARV